MHGSVLLIWRFGLGSAAGGACSVRGRRCRADAVQRKPATCRLDHCTASLRTPPAPASPLSQCLDPQATCQTPGHPPASAPAASAARLLWAAAVPRVPPRLPTPPATSACRTMRVRFVVWPHLLLYPCSIEFNSWLPVDGLAPCLGPCLRHQHSPTTATTALPLLHASVRTRRTGIRVLKCLGTTNFPVMPVSAVDAVRLAGKRSHMEDRHTVIAHFAIKGADPSLPRQARCSSTLCCYVSHMQASEDAIG